MPSKRKTSVRKTKKISWDITESRVFEPKREKVSFDLDAVVADDLKNFKEYLEFIHKQKANENGVVELILINALENEPDFQKWKLEREKTLAESGKKSTTNSAKKNDQTDASADVSDDEILENLTDKGRRKDTVTA